jgi:transcriptional regulator with XRE-family HTH domain
MDNPQDALRQRIKILVDELEGGVQRRFALALGVHATTIGEILGKRQNQPSSDLLHKIAVTYPQLRTDWLLLGEGEMLKSEPTEDTGIKKYVVSASDKMQTAPPETEQSSLKKGIGRTARQTAGEGMVVRDYSPKAQRPVGTDLIERVAEHHALLAQHEDAIAELRQLLIDKH